MKNRVLSVLFCLVAVGLVMASFNLSGCASGGSSVSGGGVLRFTLKVSDAGRIDTDGHGFYGILLNSQSEKIEVTNFETFTDFIRYDGFNYTWYHRKGNVPSPGYTWVNAGNLNSDAHISSDGTSLVVRINLEDSGNVFNQHIQGARFTAHVITTDKSNSLLGRAIDTMGQGPSMDGNIAYTILFDRGTGIVAPYPPGYPNDPLDDYDIKQDLSGFPYNSYDIEKFNVELE